MSAGTLSFASQLILVAGSSNIRDHISENSSLAKSIGAKIVSKENNWTLLNGGAKPDSPAQYSVDYMASQGAEDVLHQQGASPMDKILTLHPLRPPKDRSFHNIFRVETSRRATPEYRRFDLVARADAIITIEGSPKGTHQIFELAMAMEKPILPLPCTGGSSEKDWNDNENDILSTFDIQKGSDDYRALTKQLDQTSQLTDLVIRLLCKKLRPICFVAMPFKDEFNKVYDEAIGPSLAGSGFNPLRGDHITKPGHIVEQVVESVRKSSLFLADITGFNSNVMYELGMAEILGKPIIIIWQPDEPGKAREKIPFDIYQNRRIEYDKQNMKRLGDDISKFSKQAAR
jgi:hypothetical protein